MSRIGLLATCSMGLIVVEAHAEPAGTAFNYQGQLKKDGMSVNDTCDMEFALYDAKTNGLQIGPTLTFDGAEVVPVVDGLFDVSLDFGRGAFSGDARWLKVAIQCTGDAGFTPLSPRQRLRPASICFPVLY